MRQVSSQFQAKAARAAEVFDVELFRVSLIIHENLRFVNIAFGWPNCRLSFPIMMGGGQNFLMARVY